MANNESYINAEFTKGLVEMMTSNDREGVNLASQVFDNILEDEKEFNKFAEEFDHLQDNDKNNLIYNNATHTALTNNIANHGTFKINEKYIELCLQHTRWMVEHHEKFNTDHDTNT